MTRVGFISVGKIGLPICEHLIRNGYTFVGYRRSPLEDFKKLGGIAARSAAEVGAQTFPDDEAAGPAHQGGRHRNRGSTQFVTRALRLAERRFTPQQGSASSLAHHLDTARDVARDAGVATAISGLSDRLFKLSVPGVGEHDVAAIPGISKPPPTIERSNLHDRSEKNISRQLRDAGP